MLPKLTYNDYKKRFVGFIDLLGFSNQVSSINGEDSFLKVASALELLSTTAELINNNDNLFEDFSITAISDSLIVSVPSDSLSRIYALLSVLHNLQYQLVYGGLRILLRGYLVEGNAYHKNGYIFGDGYMNAYRLESSLKGPPRIMIDPGALTAIDKLGEISALGKMVSPREFLTVDQYDGATFINYLKPFPSKWLSYGDDFANQRQELEKFILTKIDNSKSNLGIYTKYKWLLQHLSNLNAGSHLST